MTELQQSRYDSLMRRVGDLKGPGSKVNDVLEELFPVLDVEQVPGELLILAGTDLCVGAGSIAGAVGEVGRIQLFNPVGSGKIMTVTTVISSFTGNSTMRLGISVTPLTNGVGTETFRDTRRAGASQPTGQIRTVSSVAFANATWQFAVLANRPQFIHDPNGIVVLSEGFGIDTSPADTVLFTLATFMWRERLAEPSELNL